MKHAINLLEAEFERLQKVKLEMRRKGKPRGYRDSEWAMTVGRVERERLETFEALQMLRKASSPNAPS